MRAVIQRVSRASVTVDGTITAEISKGVVVFLGIHKGDTEKQIVWMIDKINNLRIFPDPAGKMNISLADIRAEMLIVSQFTLYGDCRKGRRPGYSEAAPPEQAELIYNQFIEAARSRDIPLATGTFQAMMDVALVNDGPVTLLLDSDKLF